MGRYARKALSAAAVAAFVLPLVAVGVYAGAPDAVSALTGKLDRAEQLRRSPAYRAAEFLRRETPSDSIVLSLKPADMYYAERTMVSYLDPRLLDFYAARDQSTAYAALRRLKVRYIHMPDYSLPPIYNSQLEALVAECVLSARKAGVDRGAA